MNNTSVPAKSRKAGVLHVLASGSSGNCCCIETGKALVFIDAGVGLKHLMKFIGNSGKSLDESYFFITHEHGDHISGLLDICRRFYYPKIYASEGTIHSLGWKGIPNFCMKPLKKNKPYRFPSFSVTAFKTHHDAYEPYGYTVQTERTTFGVLTDCGMITESILKSISDVTHLILEANYDPEMLANGPYIKFLKDRIASPKGHLSNDDACRVLAGLAGGALKECHFGHVSEKNNDYALLARLADFCQKLYGIKVDVLRQKTYYSYDPAITAIDDGEIL
jgi:phosphoribosyl 1,2-cyclic phosphodiesterase